MFGIIYFTGGRGSIRSLAITLPGSASMLSSTLTRNSLPDLSSTFARKLDSQICSLLESFGVIPLRISIDIWIDSAHR